MIVLPDAEDRTIVLSFIWTKYRNVTDRQTDRIPLSLSRTLVNRPIQGVSCFCVCTHI